MPPKDHVIGKIKETAGALTGNEALEHEGELQQSKADAEAEAARLDECAQQRTEVTEVETRQREIELDQQRLAAEAAERARFDAIDAEEAAELRRVEAIAHEREVAADRLDQQAADAERTADLIDGTREQMEA